MVDMNPVIHCEIPEDVDGTLEVVKEHGGEVFHEKNPAGNLGFSAYFTDPEGNLIGLW